MPKLNSKRILSINLDLVNQNSPSSNADDKSYHLSDCTYRQDGVTIGKDFLRIDGKTLTRYELDINKLEVLEIIGRGAFSKVRKAHWLGKENHKGEPFVVALKECRMYEDSRQSRDILLREIRALTTVTSPNLVHMYGAFLSSDSVRLVLEYMDHGSLADLLRRHSGGFPVNIVASITYQLLMGLCHLHADRRLHRDIKPANVLINSSGFVKLCDFGMACLGASVSLNTTVLGTAKYMSPERLRARTYGRASDVWSLGLVTLECATGIESWKGISSIVELVVSIEEKEADELIPRTLPEGLREILAGSLCKNPGETCVASCRTIILLSIEAF